MITFEGLFYYSLRAFKFSLDTDHLNDSPFKFDGMLEYPYVVSVGLSDPALASFATSLYSRLLVVCFLFSRRLLVVC